MVDTSKYAESKFLTADVVNKLSDSTGVVIDVSEEEKTFQGKKEMKLVANISFEGGRVKEWVIPYSIVASFNNAWGTDSAKWVGKKALFMASGKSVVAKPLLSLDKEERV